MAEPRESERCKDVKGNILF